MLIFDQYTTYSQNYKFSLFTIYDNIKKLKDNTINQKQESDYLKKIIGKIFKNIK